ncbi:class A beta-lactamase [Chitinophaga silvisoli]|uniref:beta-lactamase n=1 Tax=Chitinophaga silvisoli TaxID=2291814 RepID=A0A3E1P3I9_9BACT|nr:class A beta-lactamase [Chitinophaga silvisoli]RFM34568.1 class A beta-lactamase [Chitinophaga silvisoli]
MPRKTTIVLLLACLSASVHAQTTALRKTIDSIVTHSKAHIGVSALLLETGDTLSYRGNDHYPMQSVYKFPISFAILHQVDLGKYKPDQKITITSDDIMPLGHSPIREAHPHGGVDMTIREISRYNIQESDGTACDVLLRLLGGTKKTNAYIRSLGVTGINIATTEKEQQQDDTTQYHNWATPIAITQLYKVFLRNNVLSKQSYDILWKDLAESHPGAKRIKGLLPPGTVVAHKTGTSGTHNGFTAATNDSGIIILPNGKHLILTIFVSDSKGSEAEREGWIAQISKAVYDHFK